jgi:hypothetical protein
MNATHSTQAYALHRRSESLTEAVERQLIHKLRPLMRSKGWRWDGYMWVPILWPKKRRN